jgi:ubiquinone/menaquinone biosynthesis C-methylase UbiE
MTTETNDPVGRAYTFDNNDPAAGDRHQILPAVLDELSRSRISSLGDLTGWRCLEVGAGGGSIAGWLAASTGPTGRVLATDVNPRHLRPDAGYQVQRHNLVEEPLPAGPWDLIHARLVLLHLPTRRQILPRLVAALAPGGALVIEDFETTVRGIVLAAARPADAELIETYHRLLVEHVLPANGSDPGWASQVHAMMLAEGLIDVDTAIHARSWPGGCPGARLIAANVVQTREHFIAAGLSDDQVAEILRLTEDPRLVVRNPLTYSTIGRRPARAAPEPGRGARA